MRSSLVFASLPLIVFAALAACTGEDPAPAVAGDAGGGGDAVAPPPPTGTDAGGTPDASALGALAIDPAIVRVLPSKTAKATITLTRNGIAGDVNVTIAGLPNGVTASVAPIAAGTTTAEATFTAAANADLGVVSFTATAPGVADAKGTLAVAGTPGSLDTTFDQDGYVLDGAISATGVYFGVTVQPDGKVIAVGTTSTSNGKWVVRRYNADGTPDTAFNTNAASWVPQTGMARGVALDPAKGRIIVVGGQNALSGTGEHEGVLRFNADGTPDQSFANAGAYLPGPMFDSQGSQANAVIVNADSTLLVAGARNFNPGATYAYVEKFDTTGQIVSSGFANYQSPVQPRQFSGIFPLAAGAFIATGTDSTSGQKQQAVRFEAKGSPDVTFGTQNDGFRSYASCGGGGGALMKNGDVVIVGVSNGQMSFCETRIAASGNGVAVATNESSSGSSYGFTGATAGGLPTTENTSYAVGFGGGTYDKYGRITHRDATGALDPAWGSGGVLDVDDPQSPDGFSFQFYAVTSTPEGRLVVVGSRGGTSAGFLLMRIWE